MRRFFSWVFSFLFKRMDGTTHDRAQEITTTHKPRYIKIGLDYKVIQKPDTDIWTDDGSNPPALYMIQCRKDSRVYYVYSTCRLPRQFWVRKIVGRNGVQYEILDESDEGTLAQMHHTHGIRRTRQPSASVSHTVAKAA